MHGIRDETLVGAPTEMIVGSVEDLKRPDAVIIDKAGYEYMSGAERYQLGRTFQLKDKRAVLVGVCRVLAAAHAGGAKLVASGCLMRALVAQIVQARVLT